MFLEELTPVVQKLVQNPIAFAGGFAAGLLHLDLNQDPVKSWLTKATGFSADQANSSNPSGSHHNGNGPQSIDIE